nr:outer membrane channel protein TolC [Vibrio sinus]
MKKLLPLLISAAIGTVSTSSWAENLTEIYNQAKNNDPTLLSSAATRDSTVEAVNSTRATLLPQINLTGQVDRVTGSQVSTVQADSGSLAGNTWTSTLGFTQTLYNRSSWIDLTTAEKNARKADATYAAAQQDLMMRTATAYFDVLKAKDNLAFVQAEKASVGRQLEQTKQRFDVGLSAITDVQNAQADYDTVLANEITAKNDLVNSYEGLREITGQEPSHLSVLDTQRFSANKLPESLDQLLAEAKKKNLSLLAARISQDIARDDIKNAEAGHLPTLSLEGGYTNAGQSDGSRTTTDYHKDQANIGLKLSVPIYSGGSVTSLTKQAEYNYIAASQDLESTYRSVVANVRLYYNNVNASIGSIQAYKQSVISAKSSLEATEAGFEVGTRTIVDVLSATQSLYQANENLADARYSYILNVLQLKESVGILSEQDILDVNAGLESATKAAQQKLAAEKAEKAKAAAAKKKAPHKK